MTDASALVVFACPSCDWTGEFDARFTQWCENCGFNADPESAKQEKEKRWTARRKARARAIAERQCDRLAAVEDLRPTSAAGVAVTVVSTLVHLVTLGLVIGSVVLALAWSKYWWAWVLGGLGILVAYSVRPQLWRLLRKPKGMDENCLTRETAPALFGLLERCTTQIGAPLPDYVLMNGAYNAGTRNVGLRGGKLLVLGVPLWTVLTGPERVALLGHELAHHVNRDVSHGVWATSARRSLAEWLKIFNPSESERGRVVKRRLARGRPMAQFNVVMPVVAACFVPVFLLVLACQSWLIRLDRQSGQRAEHLADELGARLGSSAAAISLVEQLALAESVTYFVQRQKSVRSSEDPWSALRAYLDSIPGHEKRRRVLLDERRGTRVDATHPASYLRRRLLTARPQLPGTVEVDRAVWAEIDRELTKRYAAVAHALIGTSANLRR